jgi:hypothetical protein
VRGVEVPLVQGLLRRTAIPESFEHVRVDIETGGREHLLVFSAPDAANLDGKLPIRKEFKCFEKRAVIFISQRGYGDGVHSEGGIYLMFSREGDSLLVEHRIRVASTTLLSRHSVREDTKYSFEVVK